MCNLMRREERALIFVHFGWVKIEFHNTASIIECLLTFPNFIGYCITRNDDIRYLF